MKQLFGLVLSAIIPAVASAQESTFSLEVHYGPQANFLVRSYDEDQYTQMGMTAFFKKNLVGPVGGIDLAWHLNPRSSIGLGYSRSVNSKAISYYTTMNSVNIYIDHFKIRHVSNFFQLYYSFDFRKPRSEFNIQAGLFYVRPSQQEIAIMPPFNTVEIQERNYNTSRLEEGGAFLGLAWSHKIDTKFSLGIKSRLYYTISTNTMESLTLTPTLSYHFGKPTTVAAKKTDQSGEKKNIAYFELGGNGLFASANYERQLTKKQGLSARAGIGYYADHGNFASFPVGLNYIFAVNKKQGFLDAGFGATWTTEGNSSNGYQSVYYVPSIGYRKYRNNMMLRASFAPVISKDLFTPWIGLSIGKRF